MKKSKKNCFGILDMVFPVGKGGLREVTPKCFDCPDRKTCLQAALTTKEGLAFRGELLDRAKSKGMVGWLKRWSEKKILSRLIKQKEGRIK